VASASDYDNEPSGPIKWEDFLCWLMTCRLLREDSAT
jgi:hypothetical protein